MENQILLEKAARIYADIKPNVTIDEEERYYNANCKIYDAFLEGARAYEALNLSSPSIENKL